MKITIPLIAVLSGGVLKDFYDDLVKVQSNLNISKDETDVFIENGNIDLTLNELNQILNAGGEVEEYLMAIRADLTMLGEDLPNGLPNRTTIDENASVEIRKFKNWFDSTAEVYKSDNDGQIYFLTNPIGNSTTEYLKASQIALVYGLNNLYNVAVRSVTQFNNDIQSGWIKINF